MGGLPGERTELPQRRAGPLRARPAWRGQRGGRGRVALAAALAAALAGLLAAGCGGVRLAQRRAPTVHHDGRYAMGTVLEVMLVTRSPGAAHDLAREIFARTAELEAELSSWERGSAVSLLNEGAGGPPQRVPPATARALAEAVRATERTRGAFDVTVGPLVELWREAEERGRLPTDEEIAAVRARVGPDRIRLLEDGRVALAPGARIDLGGLAKGFTLDRIAALLRDREVPGALVSFGQSSLFALGRPPNEPGFRVLLRGAGEASAGVATLPSGSHLSVSGSFGQWREIEGRRLGHVIDPRTGRPLERPALAAVLAPSGSLAEALSKALLVLEPAEGIALVEETPEAEGLHVDEAGELRMTSGFAERTRFVPLGPAPPDGEPPDVDAGPPAVVAP